MTLNTEDRRRRREEQDRKRQAVSINIDRPEGITNKELCNAYGFYSISIKRQARYLSIDVIETIDADGQRRYRSLRPRRQLVPLAALVSVRATFPSGNEIIMHGLTPQEAAELDAMDSER